MTEEIQPLIEGGSTTGEQTEPPHVGPPTEPEKHRRLITILLIGLLALVILGHYTVVAVLEWNGRKVDTLTNAFNSILPVVSGLVGSSVTYYFTKSNAPK